MRPEGSQGTGIVFWVDTCSSCKRWALHREPRGKLAVNSLWAAALYRALGYVGTRGRSQGNLGTEGEAWGTTVHRWSCCVFAGFFGLFTDRVPWSELGWLDPSGRMRPGAYLFSSFLDCWSSSLVIYFPWTSFSLKSCPDDQRRLPGFFHQQHHSFQSLQGGLFMFDFWVDTCSIFISLGLFVHNQL